MTVKISLGERIRELRDAKRMSLRDLAAVVDVSPPYLCDIELGRRFPSSQILSAIAAALNVPVLELQQHDHRTLITQVRQRSSADPAYAYWLRELLEYCRTADQLREVVEKKLASKRNARPA